MAARTGLGGDILCLDAARLFALQPVEHEARDRASYTPEDRRCESIHHGTHRTWNKLNKSIDKLRNGAVIGLLAFFGLLLECLKDLFGLGSLFGRCGNDCFD